MNCHYNGKTFIQDRALLFEVQKKIGSRLLSRWSGLFEKKSQDQSYDDTVKQWSKTGLVMRQGKPSVAFRHSHEPELYQ